MVKYRPQQPLQRTFAGQPSVPRPVEQYKVVYETKTIPYEDFPVEIKSLYERYYAIQTAYLNGEDWDASELSALTSKLRAGGYPVPEQPKNTERARQLIKELKTTQDTTRILPIARELKELGYDTGIDVFTLSKEYANQKQQQQTETTQQYTVLYKSPGSEEKYNAIQFDVVNDKGITLAYGTESWIRYLHRNGYYVGELWNPETKKWEWGAYAPEEMIEGRSYNTAKAIVEMADRGDSVQKIREHFMNYADWGTLLTQQWNIITGNNTKENRIKNLQQVIKKKMRTDSITFFIAQPSTEIAIALASSKAIGFTGGFIKSVAPKVYTGLFKPVMTAATIYSGKEAVTGGIKIYKQEGAKGLATYSISTGASFVAGGIGFSSSFKSGEVYGYRKILLSKASTDIERARLTDIFKALDRSKKLSSVQRRTLDVTVDVAKLQNNPKQQQALLDFLKSPEAKQYKIVMKGSASQTTYVSGRQAQDIDIGVKSGIWRPTVKRTGKWGLELGSERPSKVGEVTELMRKYGIDISLYDIHEFPKPGTPFSAKGTGYSERPIKTKGTESPFKYQTRLSEQAGRKWAQALSPEHTLRGKDWYDSLKIASQKWRQTTANKELLGRLEKWKPQLKEGTYELSGPSYYQLHPSEAPTRSLTIGERFLRRYGTNIETQYDLFQPGTKLEGTTSIKAEKFRPQLDIIPKSKLLTKLGTIMSERPTSYLFLSEFGQYLPEKYYEKFGLPIRFNFYSDTKQTTKQVYPSVVTPSTIYPTLKTNLSIYPITKSIYKTYPYPKTTPIVYPKSTYKYYSTTKKTIFPAKPRKPVISITTESDKQPEQTRSYNVYAKKDATKKTKWISIGKDLPLNEALSIGSQSVDETVSRTFKISRSSNPAVSKGYTGWQSRSHKFREPKRNKVPGTYIEKTSYAIDSRGEHEGITVQGWLARRKNLQRPIESQKQYRPNIKLPTEIKPFKMGMIKL